MKYSLSTEIYEEIDVLILDRLFLENFGLHDYLISNSNEYRALESSMWYNSSRPQIKKLLEEKLSTSVQNSFTVKPRIIISKITGVSNFTIEEALVYLNQKFLVYVENTETDGAFFDALIRLFRTQSKAIKKFQAKNKFGIGMSGGSEILKAMNRELEDLSKADVGGKTDVKKLNRIFVLLDSDKEYPNDTIGKKNIIEFCDENNIDYYILEKRMVENYLPELLIEKLKIGKNDKFINAMLKELNPTQLDYFNMEKGINHKHLHENKDLSDFHPNFDKKNNLDTHQWDRTIVANMSFKKYVSMLWQDPDLNQEHLLERCTHHSDDPNIHPYNKRELPDLVQKIADLL